MTENIPLYGSHNSTYSQSTYSDTIGKRNYELTNHLGNVLSVISDKVIPHSTNGTTVDWFQADIRQSTDYSAFGVQLTERNIMKNDPVTGLPIKDYSMGFQGQLEDDQIKGEGNSVNYEYRMHDPRIGRFFAIDPLTPSYPELTPYQFSSNSPIFMVELEGKEGKITVVAKWYTNKGVEKSKAKTYTVEGLKADLYKVCWKPHSNPNGEVVKIDYYGRMEDGSRSEAALKGFNPDAKPSVTELNAFFAKDPNNSFNVAEAEKARVASIEANQHWYDGTILAPDALSGEADGANYNSDYAGSQGMRKGADDLSNLGIVISYTRVGAPLGAGLGILSDLLKTGADIAEGNPHTVYNLAVRVGNTVINNAVAKKIDLLPVQDFNKQVIKGAVNQGTGIVVDEKTKVEK